MPPKQRSLNSEISRLGLDSQYMAWLKVATPALSYVKPYVSHHRFTQAATAARNLHTALSSIMRTNDWLGSPFKRLLENLESNLRDHDQSYIPDGLAALHDQESFLAFSFNPFGIGPPKDKCEQKGGRPLESQLLYLLLPGLVIYTSLHSKSGKPRWALIQKWVLRNFGNKYRNLNFYWWWWKNLQPIRNLRDSKEVDQRLEWRKMVLILRSVLAYIHWSTQIEDRRTGNLRPLHLYHTLNAFQKRYIQRSIKLFPFLEGLFVSWLNPNWPDRLLPGKKRVFSCRCCAAIQSYTNKSRFTAKPSQ